MAKLGLSGPEFSEGFCDGHTFHPTLQQLVKSVTASRDPFNPLPLLEDLHPSLEIHAFELLSDLITLVSFSLCDSLDV